jgi:hypothetical protein
MTIKHLFFHVLPFFTYSFGWTTSTSFFRGFHLFPERLFFNISVFSRIVSICRPRSMILSKLSTYISFTKFTCWNNCSCFVIAFEELNSFNVYLSSRLIYFFIAKLNSFLKEYYRRKLSITSCKHLWVFCMGYSMVVTPKTR